eukprot:CAMPEP_0117545378 /NCGR_PEP_ID=MMETSP0784-20121206/46063_1 /TAXON_ID=39447 /ORGANISM="" /LENGTH=928 /DNA_ID=CAMNT_0005342221 /DNA_START=45 /DNA_END=2828 /DNA_ORIENTATION=+
MRKNVSAKNTLFVRNLSQQVSEQVIRDIFGGCDDIEQVLFRSYPHRANEIFAQIDFKTPKGVMEGHQLSGTSILGVPCEVSVIDPGTKDLMKNLLLQQASQEQPPAESEGASEPQGVQAEYMKKYRLAVEDKRLRTVHIAGIEKGVTEEQVRFLCGNFGEVEAARVDEDGEGQAFALVEFKEQEPAHVCKVRHKFLVDGRVVTFTESRTLVNTTEFAERSVHFQTPVFDANNFQAIELKQTRLNSKLAKAMKAANELFNEPLPPNFVDPDEVPPEGAEPKPADDGEQGQKQASADGAEKPDSDSRKRRRRSHSREVPRDRRRRAEGLAERPRRRERRRHEHHEADGTIDVDAEEIALVPNTEKLVLGASSSYSSASSSPVRVMAADTGEAVPVNPGLARLSNLEARLAALKNEFEMARQRERNDASASGAAGPPSAPGARKQRRARSGCGSVPLGAPAADHTRAGGETARAPHSVPTATGAKNRRRADGDGGSAPTAALETTTTSRAASPVASTTSLCDRPAAATVVGVIGADVAAETTSTAAVGVAPLPPPSVTTAGPNTAYATSGDMGATSAERPAANAASGANAAAVEPAATADATGSDVVAGRHGDKVTAGGRSRSAEAAATGGRARKRRRRRRAPVVRDVSSESPARSLPDGPSPIQSVPDEADEEEEVAVATSPPRGLGRSATATGITEDVAKGSASPSASPAAPFPVSLSGKGLATTTTAATATSPGVDDAAGIATTASTPSTAPALGDCAAAAGAVAAGAGGSATAGAEAAGGGAADAVAQRQRRLSAWQCRRCDEMNRPSRRHCNNCGCRPDGTHPAEDVLVGSSSSSSSEEQTRRRKGDGTAVEDGSSSDDGERSHGVKSVAESPARSIRDDDDSPANEGKSPRSIADSPERGVVDLSEEEEDMQFEKEVWSGQAADA